MKPTKSQHFEKTLSKNSKFKSDLFFSIIIFFIMIFIISNPKVFSAATISGLNLFINSVMPGLFPFMFLTKLLTEIGYIFLLSKHFNKFSNKLFGTPGISFYAFLMSILSGYPIGAKIISDLYLMGAISQKDAQKISIFCTTSGPIFVIGAVGVGMLENYKVGLILYFSHIFSSILMGVLYNLLTKEKSTISLNKTIINIEKKENIFSNCIVETINSIFIVGAYITIFYLISELLINLKIINSLTNILSLVLSPINISKIEYEGFLFGLIEVTRGCKILSQSSSFLAIATSCGLISFSGISIILQSMAFLKNTQIKMHRFIFSKLVHMTLSIFLCYLGLTIFM